MTNLGPGTWETGSPEGPIGFFGPPWPSPSGFGCSLRLAVRGSALGKSRVPVSLERGLGLRCSPVFHGFSDGHDRHVNGSGSNERYERIRGHAVPEGVSCVDSVLIWKGSRCMRQKKMNLQRHSDTARRTLHGGDQLCETYRAFLLTSLKASFPAFVRNFEDQNGPMADGGRVAVLDFEANGDTQINQFASAIDLRSYLENEKLHAPDGPPRKRLYVLEDISRDKTQLLGSRLRVPPSVFAAHWDDPATSQESFDHDCFLNSGPQYLRLRYRQVHRVDGNYPLGLYGDRNSNVPRWLQLLDRDRRFETSEHHFSFWGSEYGLESWTALLLVDPLIIEARSYPEGYRVRLDHPDTGEYALPYPRPISTNILPPDPAQWASIRKVGLHSMFDGILEYYKNSRHSVSKDPRSAISAARRIALYMWRGYLRSREEDFYLLSDEMHYRQSPDHPHGWFYTWGLSWRVEVFRKLTFGKTVIERANASLRSISIMLDLSSANGSNVDQYEAAEWRSLLDGGASLASKFDNLTSEYVQEASIQESRGVGRLTKLATVLVPFSITAGIFSMGDDYLVGKRLFWVFWAVAIPLALLFSIIVFTTFISTLWSGMERIIWNLQWRRPFFQKRNA